AAILVLVGLPAPHGPAAQTGLSGLGAGRTASNEPVTFTAEEVEFDQNSDTVSARGRVEAWQGDRVLRADRFTYNRTTGIATAEGNVVLIEPDGQALFADRAELSGGMRDAALEGLRGLLTSNARLAAAGARRTGGTVTDLARVVYSACDLCPEDPTRPPLWQLRARIASLHSDEQRVRYRDASVQFGGIPLLYTPYLSHASPDAPRASGFLSPSFGITRLLGGFAEIPYYWAIDDHSDATITPTLSSNQGGNLGLAYRRRFNSGQVALEGSVGHLGQDTPDTGIGGHILARGQFAIDDIWRTGFTLNRASSRDYLRAYRYGSPRVLTSEAYAEGFWGTEGYVRFDSRLYQGLYAEDSSGLIPFVLPLGYAEYAAPPDRFGGRFTVDAQAFNILRSSGTDTRRLGTRAGYELPLIGRFGEVWTFRSQADLVGGWVTDLDMAPNFGPSGADGSFGQGNIRAALDWRWPLIRPAGDWGTQLVEPRLQVVTGPSTGAQTRIPNEDSLDFEFTDANLFALNRFPGRDRLEGGTRVDAALRGAWLFPNGGQIEGLVGRSFRADDDRTFPTGSGLDRRESDWVGRLRLAPVPWFELAGRARLDGDTQEPRLWDLTGTVFAGRFALNAGYLRGDPLPGSGYTKRDEVSAGTSFNLTQNWRVGLFGRYDLALDRPVAAQAVAAYEDECLIFETRFVRRWAEDPATRQEYASGTLLLFRVTLKTVGDFGIRAL
ncbi:LPS-assembly protein LptD, partial [Falsiroseomonas sp. CW058]|uniref:LPS-assembly protein LptD n=1 Tax=Falsiroseomonas sp. CW058 TaxID=3388664 RepID=UPI003D321685